MKILESYKIEADGVPGQVNIIKKPGEFVPIYELILPKFEEATIAILDAIKAKLITVVRVKPQEILDPRIMEELKKRFFEKAFELIEKEFPNVSREEKEIFAGTLVHEMLGLGDIELLLVDENLEDIVINNSQEPLWVYHRKYGWLKTNVKLESDLQIYNYAALIGRRVGRSITSLNPLMDAQLTSGDRVNATLFPISTKGNTISIRKFARRPWTITDFIKINTISEEVAAFLWLAIQYELNMIISGGTGTGKTSFLNVLTTFIPPNHRVISIEDTREIRLPDFLHWVPMTTREPNPEGKGEVCVYPGTFFVDGDGVLYEISEYVNNSFKKNRLRKIKSNVFVTDGNGHTVLGGDPRRFEYISDKIKFNSKITERKFICRIFCEDGEAIRITENTKIPVIGVSGEIELLKPKEIKDKKFYLPVFTHLKINSCYQFIRIWDMCEKDFYAAKLGGLVKEVLNELTQKYSLNYLAKICGVKRQALYWYKKTGIIRLDILKKLIDLSENLSTKEIEKKVVYLKPKAGKIVKIPKIIDEKLAYLAGFLLAEKTISKNGIVVVQKKRVPFLQSLVREIFGIRVRVKNGKYKRYQILSKVVKEFMKKFFGLKKSKEIRVPKCIMKSPEKVIASFLAGFIDGDGSVSKGKISLATSNEKAAKEFKYLLLRLGIWSRIYPSKRVYQVNITTREDLKRACKILPFKVEKNKKAAMKNLQLDFSTKTSRRGRIPSVIVKKYLELFRNILSKEEKYKHHFYHAFDRKSIPKKSLLEIIKIAEKRGINIPENERKNIELLLRPDLEFVEITHVEIMPNTQKLPTYDITPESHTYFVAGINNFTLVQDTMLDLMVNALRMRPDRIIVGEIRRAREAEVLFEAMHTGHSVYATLHADTAEQTIRRMINPPINVPETMLEALHLIAVMHRDRRKGIRRTFQVAEIVPPERGPIGLNILYRWRADKDEIIPFRPSVRVIETLKLFTGMTDQEIKKDLKNKMKVLRWMVKNNINTVNTVGRVVSEYYLDEEKVLKIINENQSPELILGKFARELKR